MIRRSGSDVLAALQGVSHFKDISYTNSITYGEMFMQNEYEMGRYNLEEADVAVQRRRFALYEQVWHLTSPKLSSARQHSHLEREPCKNHLASNNFEFDYKSFTTYPASSVALED